LPYLGNQLSFYFPMIIGAALPSGIII